MKFLALFALVLVSATSFARSPGIGGRVESEHVQQFLADPQPQQPAEFNWSQVTFEIEAKLLKEISPVIEKYLKEEQNTGNKGAALLVAVQKGQTDEQISELKAAFHKAEAEFDKANDAAIKLEDAIAKQVMATASGKGDLEGIDARTTEFKMTKKALYFAVYDNKTKTVKLRVMVEVSTKDGEVSGAKVRILPYRESVSDVKLK